jgi:signal peptidase II
MLGRGLTVAAVTALLDQASKRLVLMSFGEPGLRHHVVAVSSYFDLVLTRNTGVSFGMLNQTGINSAFFSLAAVLIVVILIFWLNRVQTTFLAVAIGLIMGGAIGNVIDRLRLGGVVDFLYFHLPVAACSGGGGNLLDGCWPAFNLADSAICLGVAAMLLDGFLLRRTTSQAKGREDLSP